MLVDIINFAFEPMIEGRFRSSASSCEIVYKLELKRIENIVNLLNRRSREYGPSDYFKKFITELESKGWQRDNLRSFENLMKTLRQAANIEKKKSAELYVVLLLVLARNYKYSFDTDNNRLKHLILALHTYYDLSHERSIPDFYKALALYEYSSILYEIKEYNSARVNLENLLERYKDFSGWEFYEGAKLDLMDIRGIQGEETIKLLVKNCSEGDSTAILAVLGASIYSKWLELNHLGISPFPAIFSWAENKKLKDEISDEEFQVFKRMINKRMAQGHIYGLPEDYPRAEVRHVWLWWLRNKDGFPAQRLPGKMNESELLIKFVEEIKKDPELASEYKDLLDRTVKEIGSTGKNIKP